VSLEETIHREEVDTVVASSEIFSADEAAELFRSYYTTGWVPSSYVLRLLSIDDRTEFVAPQAVTLRPFCG